MLGLKREIIKERGAAGEVREGGRRGGTERFRLEIDEVMQTGVTRTSVFNWNNGKCI